MYLFEKKIEYNVSTAGIRILHIHILKRYIRVYKNVYMYLEQIGICIISLKKV